MNAVKNIINSMKNNKKILGFAIVSCGVAYDYFTYDKLQHTNGPINGEQLNNII